MTDLAVIGGGVMGLMTAYHASARGFEVEVLERGRIGDPMTASFGRTRSYRSDYLDPRYARLAREATALWNAFEAETGVRALIRCGCMNIASSAVTPNLAGTYAHLSHETQRRLGIPTESLDGAELRERFPYLNADLAHVDLEGGVVDLRTVTATLQSVLADRGVRIVEGAEVASLDDVDARAVVVTAGHGTNGVLAGAPLQVPITRDRPVEARYYAPADPAPYHSDAMPVIAYLDAGIYCHPIVDGVVDRIKIGYYHPPDLPRTETSIDGIDAFVDRCMPGLAGVAWEPVTDTDGCDYDLVADDEFVLGAVPGTSDAYVGVGWRGTGYKFAPWVGRVLSELALQGGTVYDIGRFDPARFTEGGAGDGPPVDPHTAAASG